MEGIPSWIRALVIGLLAGALIELSLWLLRRFLARFHAGLLFHWWALAAAVFFTVDALPALFPRNPVSVWAFGASALLLLTALSLFQCFDQLVLARPQETTGAPRVPGLVRDVARLVIAIAVLACAATIFHQVDWQTVVVSSTVISAVLGLALQDVLKNIFAGMAMQIEGLPKAGDWLETTNGSARVIEMSWRTTHLRTNEGVDLIEPNASISQQRLINYGSGRKPVGFRFDIGLPYDQPPAKVKAALLRAARATPGVEERPEPRVFLESFSDSAIVYRLRVWTRLVQRQIRFRDAVQSRIWYELQRSGISVPFPTRTLHLHRAEEETEARNEQEHAAACSLLDRVQLFENLGSEAREEIAAAAGAYQFDEGEALIREGEQGDSLYVIAQGSAKVWARKGSKSVELATLTAGDFIGEMGLLTDTARTATVVADGPCEALVINRACLQPVLDREPELVQVLARSLAERAEASAAKLEQVPGTVVTEIQSEASFLHRIQRLFRVPSQ